ncbi:hypothetical protein LEP1GSC128_2901 [Leptospira borgpetersenii str. 200801926]|uniref:Uncharacterized protein n=3 Tax=Leptospira borgpetersenii TaxID=174 RepID=M3GAJ2_LEPBO|nr:hypothetical protein LEP1GSC128_2901 [Leptospira borgpetersenii str. 200801926]EMF97931.1 hypothetical protein LEP1GSC123_4209 [Leptospira borgpetersenii str. 200701203]EMK12654.1 hypothetical protein LEP1GSC066_3641 [Leptospira sp. serovar Kenya str. Sh9]EMN11389.1 hypothetical protein LEP1GSC055_2642 [Leptospira borgpetersenii str. Brem 307]EMN18990.1 hypothetical protein LEP1GSC056_2035 [Leptospira borgpetersenii str. Brem 328]
MLVLDRGQKRECLVSFLDLNIDSLFLRSRLKNPVLKQVASIDCVNSA